MGEDAAAARGEKDHAPAGSAGDAPPVGRAPRLKEQVAAELARRIRGGALAGGEPLTELGVAAMLGVSRTPVRGAFEILERDGLIRRDQGGVAVADGVAAGPMADAPPAALSHAASWEGILRDLTRKLTARAPFGDWRVVETALAAEYGVSRTVAREVLSRLEQTGVLRNDGRSRWLLPALTPRRLAQLYEMRWVLEPVALRDAAAHAPRGLLAEMAAELDRALDAPTAPPPQELDRLERRLHVDLLSFCDNDLMRAALRSYHALLAANAELYDATREGFGRDPFIAEHRILVGALADGRDAEAAALLERHLRAALDRASDRLAWLVERRRFAPLPFLQPAE